MKVNNIIIKILSDKDILNKSNGEILIPETINYKTYKPEPNGLFCEKIFGPVKNYTCYCGKYNKIIYKNVICNNCGVKITKNNIRRKNIGHIRLAIPIVHIWYLKILPNKLSILLNISSKNIQKIIYYEKYIILDKGNLKNKYKKNSLIKESELLYIKNKYKKNKFYIDIGAKAIFYLLKNININKLYNKIKSKIINKKLYNKKSKEIKKLKIIKIFKKGLTRNNKLTNIIFNILPILPPDLRPIVSLNNNKFASSDINNFYKKIIIRNNRLKKLIKKNIPNIILLNEKRLLQESIDDLFDNSQNFKNINIKKKKTLSDIFKGKYGRFRQNLLGKRVDYSARSVIVVNPNLKLHQCKIPVDIAIELYKPFIIRDLLIFFKNYNIKYLNSIINKKKKIVIYILKNIMRNHPVLLNRAPTLHRLSILSFYPKLTNNKVIEIHPLVCSGFNADFDGDQMAIHLPLSKEAIIETKFLTLSSQNILNISNGDPTLVPSQDMLLGLYYLTKKNNNNKFKKIIFSSLEEVIIAFNNKIIKLHNNIKLKYNNKIIKTTTGRVLFNMKTPENIKFINKLLKKEDIKNIIKEVYFKNNNYIVTKFLDDIKKLGFNYAYKGGLSFEFNDNINYILKKKKKIINNNNKYIKVIEKNYKNKLISKKNKYNKIINIWDNSINLMEDFIINNLKYDNKGYNSLYMMLDSGARGTNNQIKQIYGIKGLVIKSTKNINKINIIKTPITSNFIEGLSVLEFFISTHGARKGLTDTALKTADAGYLTRRLVDSCHNLIIKKLDCGTINGVYIKNINKNIIGKYILINIKFSKKYLIKKNNIITENIYNKFKKYNIKNIYIRSILKCKLENNICAKCYGINLTNNKLITIGESIGVISAQSIGEPGTQLTLKTFHVGGIIKKLSNINYIYSKYNGIIKYKNLKYLKIKNKKIIITNKSSLFILNKNKIKIFKFKIFYGYRIYKSNNSKVKVGEKICSNKLNENIIYSKYKGYIKYNLFVKNVNYNTIINEYNNKKNIIIIKNYNKKNTPYINIINNNVIVKKYFLYKNDIILCKNNHKINIGDPIIKFLKTSIKFNDITGGLPKLSELFEMKKKKKKAIISDITGKIYYKNIKKNNKIIYVYSNIGYKKKYIIKSKKNILIKNNDYIKCGDKITEGTYNYNKLIDIKGLNYVQKIIINKLYKIYKDQNVNINLKHFEVIIKQMSKFVKILKSGNTNLIINSIVSKDIFYKKNKKILNKVIIIDNGDSIIYNKNNIINIKNIKIENYFLKLKKKKIIKYIKCIPAVGKIIIKGITYISLKNNSFMSIASFQETNKILNKYSIKNKIDNLLGLKENVMIGNLIPSGTGYFKN
ncbi:MAG: DNA-directed RNA polymerase subunit beta' [Candidatus Shikimatogenerans sp. Tcar]|uniref:DNA-directed RNA polymerase subunit beta' n=1 Tax=Candidatus Shikimatogenerans sp. Tcar TaxID=3158565 RepID=A0AAU7QSJ4_9FLAO